MPDDKPFVLPRRVQVGPFTYVLSYDAEEDGEGRYARTRHFPQRDIRIGRLAPDSEMPNTIVHELTHVVTAVYKLKLSEDEVTRLANGLTQGLQSMGLLPEEIVLEGDDG